MPSDNAIKKIVLRVRLPVNKKQIDVILKYIVWNPMFTMSNINERLLLIDSRKYALMLQFFLYLFPMEL